MVVSAFEFFTVYFQEQLQYLYKQFAQILSACVRQYLKMVIGHARMMCKKNIEINSPHEPKFSLKIYLNTFTNNLYEFFVHIYSNSRKNDFTKICSVCTEN